MQYIPPLDGTPRVTQNYGDNPGGLNPPAGHNGRDYGVPVGTPVRAVADGFIEYEGWTTGPYNANPWWFLPGDMVIVLNTGDTGPSFVYGHLNDTCVTGGDRVKQGDIIGHTGNTGASTGPHLHFEALPPSFDVTNASYGRTDPGQYIDNQPATIQAEQDTDMAITDDDLRKIYRAVWFGVDGADLIPNEAAGHGEWPYTTLGSMTARISRDIVAPGLAGLTQARDTSAIAASVIEALGDNLAADVVAEVGKQLVQAGKQLSQ